jgi:hypothetical protein
MTPLEMCALFLPVSYTAHMPQGVQVSPTYLEKMVRQTGGKRLSECLRLNRFMDNFEGHYKRFDQSAPYVADFDPKITFDERLWVLSVAIKETGFTNDVVSNAGARSSMQTYRKYAPCKDCDLRVSGIFHAIRLYREHGTCEGAAKYNAGPNGECEGLGGMYAVYVQNIYSDVCALAKTECPIDWGC